MKVQRPLALLKRIVKPLVPQRVLCGFYERKIAEARRQKFERRILRYQTLSGSGCLDDINSALAKVRMHAHVMDKGLHRSDWDKGHGENNYTQCRLLLEQLEGVQDPTCVWAKRVVGEYERRTKCTEADHIPFGEPVASCCSISPEQLQLLLKARTSTRFYTGQRVLTEQVEKMVVAALEAPSSCNRQAIKVYASVCPSKAREIARHFIGFTGFGEFVPAVVVICMDLRPYDYPKELFTPSLDAGLAMENAVLMACALGLSMTQLIWTGEDDREVGLRRLLGISEFEEVMVGAVCGYPAQQAIRPVRKPIVEALAFR